MKKERKEKKKLEMKLKIYTQKNNLKKELIINK